MRQLGLLMLVCVCACSSDDGDATIDAPGAGLDAPMSTATDASSNTGDAADAGAVIDGPMSADAGPVALGPIDCTPTVGCPGQSTCADTAPGGVCTGCGNDNDCPSDTTCEDVGACLRSCEDDTDCSAGKRCGNLGVCILRSCTQTPDCPQPYVCDANFCRRPFCNGDVCPSPLLCDQGVCVEPAPV